VIEEFAVSGVCRLPAAHAASEEVSALRRRFSASRFSNLLVNQNVDPLPVSLSDSDLAVHHPYQLP